jgi:hypothetical protein
MRRAYHSRLVVYPFYLLSLGVKAVENQSMYTDFCKYIRVSELGKRAKAVRVLRYRGTLFTKHYFREHV